MMETLEPHRLSPEELYDPKIINKIQAVLLAREGVTEDDVDGDGVEWVAEYGSQVRDLVNDPDLDPEIVALIEEVSHLEEADLPADDEYEELADLISSKLDE